MRSQIEKRMNVNLTNREMKSLEKLTKMERFEGWTKSDLIRQAINVYAREMGEINATKSGYNNIEKKEYIEIWDDDDLPY